MGKGRSPRASISACRAIERAGAGGGERLARFAHAQFEGVEPGRVGRGAHVPGVGQDAHPLAGGLVVGGGHRGVRGLGGPDQPVEEAASLRRGLDEQPVLIGCQPHQAHMLRQPRGRDGLALQPHGAPRRSGTPARRRGAHGRRLRAPPPNARPRRSPGRPPGSRRPTSPAGAPRRPEPGEKKLIASRTLVLPAPLRPHSTTGPPSSAELGRGVGAKVA